MANTFHAVIPAAGIGSRMGKVGGDSARPKQYLPFADATILEVNLRRLAQLPGLASITVAIAAEDGWWPQLRLPKGVPVDTVAGGAERADSVLNALQALDLSDDAWLLVHDAVRPCFRLADVEKLRAQVASHRVGGLLACKAADTVKLACTDGSVERSLDRQSLWLAQTPQLFRFAALRNSLRDALAEGANITDEASALEWAGHSPLIVEGSRDNIKITYAEDLAVAACILQNLEVGQ